MKKRFVLAVAGATCIPLLVAISQRKDSDQQLRGIAQKRHFVSYPSTNFVGHGHDLDQFTWQIDGPMTLLEALGTNLNKRTLQVANGVHYGWITKDDIPQLMDVLDSKEQCARMVSLAHINLSSGSSPGPSTVGEEALHMIVGYWYGFYPVKGDGQEIPATKDQVREWYRRWRLQFSETK